MLERAASCVEPASQLLVRRLELPLRSQRALGQSFWKHGNEHLHLPPWWPHYLNTVRSVPQSRYSADIASESWPLAHTQPVSTERRLGLYRSPTSSRSYTRSARRGQQASAPISERKHLLDPDLQLGHSRSVSDPNLPQTFDGATLVTPRPAPHYGNTDSSEDNQNESAEIREKFTENGEDNAQGSAEYAFSGNPAETPTPNDGQGGIIDTKSALQELLDEISRAPDEPASASTLNKVAYLFRQLTNQGEYGSQVLRIAASSNDVDLAHIGLTAFRSIPRQRRTQQDYSHAVSVSIKSNMYRQAQSINLEATSRNLNEECSPLLLLHSVSRQLWRTAAKVWQTSYEGQSQISLANPNIDGKLRAAGSKDQSLPAAILSLGQMLSNNSLMVSSDHGSLVALSRNLLRLLVSSGVLMSDITPKGLLEIFHSYSPSPKIHGQALQTLLKAAKRLDKSGLSILIYRHLRKSRPDFLPSPATFGVLVSLHCEEGASSEVLRSLLEEFAACHGVADKPSYQRILSALARQGDVDGVQEIFLDMCRVHGRPKEAAFYTPLLYAHARLGDIEGAEREMKRMESWGIKQTTYTWNILLYAYARSSQPEKTLARFAGMKSQGFNPDAVTFGTLMALHSRAGDTNAVLDIIEMAQQSNVQGSYDIIAGLVHSYCLNDQVDDAMKLAVVVTEARFAGSPIKIWNHILKYHAFQAQPEKILGVQEKMKELNVQPDGMTYAALMTGLVVIGKTEDALQILRILNLNSQLAATRFHYAIILHGYAMEGNRDMVQVVFHEMLNRFSRLDASVRMTMLRHQGRLDLTGDRDDLSSTVDLLMEVVLDNPVLDRASRNPQPGLGRKRAIDVLPSAYFEHVTSLLTAKGHFRQADRLMERYSSLSRSSYANLEKDRPPSIDILTIRMSILCSQHRWAKVEDTWLEVLKLALKVAQPINIKEAYKDNETSLKPRRDGHQDRKITDSTTSRGRNVVLDSKATNVKSMILTGFDTPLESPLDQPNLKILPSQRFLIEAAITHYLSALGQQNQHDRAIQVVEKLERVGFALTSKNLNFFIQILTQSPEYSHQLLAFTIFEQRLLSNTPPWGYLRRGKWISSSVTIEGQPLASVKIFDRKMEEKRRPGQLMPTYWTVVHLAAVLQKFQRLTKHYHAHGNRLRDVTKRAKGTCAFIRRMPYLKDRIQGTLLRGKSFIIGDRPKRTRAALPVDRSGVLESQSPVDHVPVDEVLTLEDIVEKEMDNPLDPGHHHDAIARRVRQMEQYEGQIPRDATYLERRRSFETEEKAKHRVNLRERRLLDTFNTLRHDLKLPRVMSSRRFGRPAATLQPNLRRRVKAAPSGNSLYNPAFTQLERESLELWKQRLHRLELLDQMSSRDRPPPIEARKSHVPDPKQGVEPPSADDSQFDKGALRSWPRKALRDAKSSEIPLQVQLRARIPRLAPTNRMKRSFSANRSARKAKKLRKRRRRARRAMNRMAARADDIQKSIAPEPSEPSIVPEPSEPSIVPEPNENSHNLNDTT